eukprot:CAMPEP_0117593232 /NCGR_PEP_ID=MMETSP0784-20121206/72518_1 /TAXON_ID=39447 /ORGANISM="" /LENGTH=442 /DNA_ID=CAMNT_0005395131 /DNA_START=50 /DNA_END=1376 /DNA_ORIENTATION=+
MELIPVLHGDLLRLLADRAGQHFVGLTQAARWHQHLLSSSQLRRLKNLDIAFQVTRHITLPYCNTFFDDIASTVDSHVRRPSRVSPTSRSLGAPGGSPCCMAAAAAPACLASRGEPDRSSDSDGCADGDIQVINSNASTDYYNISDNVDAEVQTVLDGANSFVVDDPSDLITMGVSNAFQALALRAASSAACIDLRLRDAALADLADASSDCGGAGCGAASVVLPASPAACRPAASSSLEDGTLNSPAVVPSDSQFMAIAHSSPAPSTDFVLIDTARSQLARLLVTWNSWRRSVVAISQLASASDSDDECWRDDFVRALGDIFAVRSLTGDDWLVPRIFLVEHLASQILWNGDSWIEHMMDTSVVLMSGDSLQASTTSTFRGTCSTGSSPTRGGDAPAADFIFHCFSRGKIVFLLCLFQALSLAPCTPLAKDAISAWTLSLN